MNSSLSLCDPSMGTILKKILQIHSLLENRWTKNWFCSSRCLCLARVKYHVVRTLTAASYYSVIKISISFIQRIVFREIIDHRDVLTYISRWRRKIELFKILNDAPLLWRKDVVYYWTSYLILNVIKQYRNNKLAIPLSTIWVSSKSNFMTCVRSTLAIRCRARKRHSPSSNSLSVHELTI